MFPWQSPYVSISLLSWLVRCPREWLFIHLKDVCYAYIQALGYGSEQKRQFLLSWNSYCVEGDLSCKINKYIYWVSQKFRLGFTLTAYSMLKNDKL